MCYSVKMRWFLFLCCVWVFACSGAVAVVPDPADAGAPDVVCATTCAGRCVDLRMDVANCGKCGAACPSGAACTQGSCQCGLGQSQCGLQCVDTKVDPKNCGKCGLVCGGDAGGAWSCVNGTCSLACPVPQVECNGTCVDTQTDPNHCGKCGNPCGFGQQCTKGVCCKSGETVCNGACVDAQSDPMNCGMCGTQCPMNTPTCTQGMCTMGVTYTQMFTQNQQSPSQCTAWNAFRSQLVGTYTSITIKGSNDMTGVTCTGAGANTLCKALQTGSNASVVNCGGRNWTVGTCGNMSIELGANGVVCQCSNGYFVRPCIPTVNWGGVNGPTCNAASQTITVVCQ